MEVVRADVSVLLSNDWYNLCKVHVPEQQIFIERKRKHFDGSNPSANDSSICCKISRLELPEQRIFNCGCLSVSSLSIVEIPLIY